MSLSQTPLPSPETIFSLKQYLAYHYPKWTILEYPSANDAIKAMRTGSADCYVTRAGQLPRYMKDKNAVPRVPHTAEQDLVRRTAGRYGFAVHPEQNAQNHAFFSADRCTRHVRQCARKGHRCRLCQDNLTTALLCSSCSLLLFGLFRKARQSAKQAQELNLKLQQSQTELRRRSRRPRLPTPPKQRS